MSRIVMSVDLAWEDGEPACVRVEEQSWGRDGRDGGREGRLPEEATPQLGFEGCRGVR